MSLSQNCTVKPMQNRFILVGILILIVVMCILAFYWAIVEEEKASAVQ